MYTIHVLSVLYFFLKRILTDNDLVTELKSFLASLHLNAREFDPLALNWLHWAAWVGSLIVSSLLTIIACLPLVTGNQECFRTI